MPDLRGRAQRLLGSRTVAFAAVVVLCVGGIVTYVLVQRSQDAAAASAAAEREAARPRSAVEDVLAVPHLVVRNTEGGPSYGKIALIPLDDPDGPRAIVDISCERISATAAGAICLQQDPGVLTSYRAVFLDSHFRQTGGQALAGIPSRARISSGGRYSASTVFVTGHSYTTAQFSAQTVITDVASGVSLGELETWKTVRGGAVVNAGDRNFWGVTFLGDGPEFYATLGTGGQIQLVKGNVTTRTMEVLGVQGACPSLSPDGHSVVYKRMDSASTFHFVAMDLRTHETVDLPEKRQVDDQVSWLDDGTVIYGAGRDASTVDFDIWSAPVDGGAPELLVPDAASPSVVVPGR